MRKLIYAFTAAILLASCAGREKDFNPSFRLVPADRIEFNSFVDCNMAAAWIGDTFRIFPGKYGEDPLWGDAAHLMFADGMNADEAFRSDTSGFNAPKMPPNVPPGQQGLHGAVWFETVYQDPKDASGKTLYAVYHNENYPSTLPYDSVTGKGYRNINWPQGLQGPESPAAVCRIGIMKSVDGGRSWDNRGIFIEDLDPRLILKPHNTSETFAGGVGDPCAIAIGDFLYLYYGEYGYPGVYDENTYSRDTEWAGQCISVARIALSDLDNPEGKALRWDGKAFTVAYDGIGRPVESLMIPREEGGGPASSPEGGFHWGPSVHWNTYLNCWVMLMGKVVGTTWKGSQVFISFNRNPEFTEPAMSQEWTRPQLLYEKPGYNLWYPSLQPQDDPDDIANRYTSLRLGRKARFFVKSIKPYDDHYASDFIIEFEKTELAAIKQ